MSDLTRPTLTVLHRTLPVQCPACRDHLGKGPAVKLCPACGTPHHDACLSEIGCSSLQCNATAVDGRDTRMGALPEEPNPVLEALQEGGFYSARVVDDSGWEASAELGNAVVFPYTGDSEFDEDTCNAANYVVLMRDHGGEPCACEVLGLTCDGHPHESRRACDWLETRRGSLAMRLSAEPCGCERNSDHEDPWRCEREALEALQSLEGYPLLEEDTESQIREWHVREALTEYGGLEDAVSSLELSEDEEEALEDAEDHMGRDRYRAELLEAFWEACHAVCQWPNYEGPNYGVAWPHADRWHAEEWRGAFREALGLEE